MTVHTGYRENEIIRRQRQTRVEVAGEGAVRTRWWSRLLNAKHVNRSRHLSAAPDSTTPAPSSPCQTGSAGRGAAVPFALLLAWGT